MLVDKRLVVIQRAEQGVLVGSRLLHRKCILIRVVDALLMIAEFVGMEGISRAGYGQRLREGAVVFHRSLYLGVKAVDNVHAHEGACKHIACVPLLAATAVCHCKGSLVVSASCIAA